jgi:four helix bundle protein
MLKVQVVAQQTAAAGLVLAAQAKRGHGDIVDQFRRSVTSVALTVAEGFERTGADERHFTGFAMGSARAASVALALLVAVGAVDGGQAAKVEQGLDAVRAMLFVLGGRVR